MQEFKVFDGDNFRGYVYAYDEAAALKEAMNSYLGDYIWVEFNKALR